MCLYKNDGWRAENSTLGATSSPQDHKYVTNISFPHARAQVTVLRNDPYPSVEDDD